jgi:hypothetical protein
VRDHFIYGDVVRFDGKLGKELEIKADSGFECTRHLREKTVVVTAASAESLSAMRKRDSGNDCKIHRAGVNGMAGRSDGFSQFPWTLDKFRKITHFSQLQGSSIDARVHDSFVAHHTGIPEQIEIWLDHLGGEKHDCMGGQKFRMRDNYPTDGQRRIVTVSGCHGKETGSENFSEIRFLHCLDFINRNVARSAHFFVATPSV